MEFASASASKIVSNTSTEELKDSNTQKTFIIPMSVEAYETQSKLATKKALEELSNQMKDSIKPKSKLITETLAIDSSTDTDYELYNDNSKSDNEYNDNHSDNHRDNHRDNHSDNHSDNDKYNNDIDIEYNDSSKKRKPSSDVHVIIKHVSEKKQKPNTSSSNSSSSSRSSRSNSNNNNNSSSSNISKNVKKNDNTNTNTIHDAIFSQHDKQILKLETSITNLNKELSLVKSNKSTLKKENTELETKLYFIQIDNCNNLVFINKLKEDNEKLTKSIENNSIINKKYIEILKKENEVLVIDNKKKDAIIKKNDLHMHFMKLLILFLLIMYILA
jgi:hypothetical protein